MYFTDFRVKVFPRVSDDAKEMFTLETSKRLERKRANCKVLTLTKYNELLARIERIKNRGPCSSVPSDYKVIKRYDVIEIDSEHRIVNKNTGKILVFAEEMYDIIKTAHIEAKHGGRDQTFRRIKTKYDNITTEMIVLFIEKCECQYKRRKSEVIEEQ